MNFNEVDCRFIIHEWNCWDERLKIGKKKAEKIKFLSSNLKRLNLIEKMIKKEWHFKTIYTFIKRNILNINNHIFLVTFDKKQTTIKHLYSKKTTQGYDNMSSSWHDRDVMKTGKLAFSEKYSTLIQTIYIFVDCVNPGMIKLI
jgi:hypothetical protein